MELCACACVCACVCAWVCEWPCECAEPCLLGCLAPPVDLAVCVDVTDEIESVRPNDAVRPGAPRELHRGTPAAEPMELLLCAGEGTGVAVEAAEAAVAVGVAVLCWGLWVW